MKRFWMRSVLSILLCAALLTGCAAGPDADPAASPADPLTGQELQVTDGSGTSLLPAAPSGSAGS